MVSWITWATVERVDAVKVRSYQELIAWQKAMDLVNNATASS